MAAAISGSGAPAIQVTTQDLQTRFSLLAATDFAPARTHAILTSAGTILRAAVAQGNDPNALTLYRVTSPSAAGPWQAAGNVIASNAKAAGGCALAQTGSTIRCFYISNATNGLVYRDSTNDGQTWGAETAAQSTPSGQQVCTGIAAASINDVSTAWYIYAQAASAIFRTQYTSSWSAWSNTGPSSPSWGRIAGLAVDASLSPYVFAAGVQMRAQKSGYAGATCTLSGSTWSAWQSLQDMDTPDNGLCNSYLSVHYDSSTGYYYAGVNLADTGAVSGTAQNRVTFWRSKDGVAWQVLQTIAGVSSYEFHWLVVNGTVYALDNVSVYTAPPSPAVTDLSADLLAVHIHEELSRHTAFEIVVANQNGQYLGQVNLRDNAHVQISLGYNGQSVVTHNCYIDAISYSASPELQTVTIHGRGPTKFLAQPSSWMFTLTGLTVGALATKILQLAKVQLSALPATSQFSTAVPSFTISAGETWWQALTRLSGIYDFEVFSVVPSTVKLVERSASDASTWKYGAEALGIAWQQNADQPNVIRVVGASPSTTNVFAEVQDTANLILSGAHRYEHIVDRLCDTAAKCLLKAQLSLRDNQTRSQTGSLTVALNPQLELNDVITITDSRVGLTNQSARVTAITTKVDMQTGEFLQELGLELP